MDEFALIDRYFRRAGRPPVVVGVGDDGAVLDVPAGSQLVCVIDTLVEGVHFPAGFDPADLGYRVVAVNLSDLAAMGADPAWMTLALTLPEARPAWLEAFANGLYEAAEACGVQLAGGDTTRGRELVVSVQMAGHVAAGRYLRRSGAGAGDRIYVSGTLGDASVGLAHLQDGNADSSLARRFSRPIPRVALGRAAAGIASAAIDISDGFVADLQHVLDASGCGAVIDCAQLPLSQALLEGLPREAAERHALTGGDDYELLFTVRAARAQELEDAAAASETPLACVGEIRGEEGIEWRNAAVDVASLASGWNHFGTAS